MYPLSFRVTFPLRKSVFGVWPMATNRPATASSLSEPVTVSSNFNPEMASSPITSVTTVFQRNRILGFARALSCMIFEARSSSLRWMRTTSFANLVR